MANNEQTPQTAMSEEAWQTMMANSEPLHSVAIEKLAIGDRVIDNDHDMKGKITHLPKVGDIVSMDKYQVFTENGVEVGPFDIEVNDMTLGSGPVVVIEWDDGMSHFRTKSMCSDIIWLGSD